MRIRQRMLTKDENVLLLRFSLIVMMLGAFMAFGFGAALMTFGAWIFGQVCVVELIRHSEAP
jgi:hypothetical protein